MATNGTNGTAAPPVDIRIATTPNNLDGVPTILKEITAGVDALSTGGAAARYDLLLKARSMVQALETPRETMIKHCWAQPGAWAGICTGMDTGLWSLMAKNGDRPQTVRELAEGTKMDPLLLARLMRHIAAMGYLEETGTDEYKPTNWSKSLSLPIIGDGYLALSQCSIAAVRFHEFARKTEWKNPTDAKKTALAQIVNSDLDLFTWMQSIGYGLQFNRHMGGYRQGRMPWMSPDFFPVQERLIDGADTSPDAPFLVDVGGGLGHDLQEFKNNIPNHPGKLILQDLPMVIGQIQDLNSDIVKMEHDFHKPQPVKGARAYYMHSVLHDWPDDVCKSILAPIKEAMKPGYSKLLILENVIPPTNAYWETSALDMMMLSLLSSMERTEADWYRVIEKIGGLKIVKIWPGGKGTESMIEVELP